MFEELFRFMCGCNKYKTLYKTPRLEIRIMQYSPCLKFKFVKLVLW